VTKLLLIAAGGGAGALLRFLVSGWGQRLTESTFPVGTLVVNVSGCLLIGFAGGALSGPWIVREELRLALLVGLLGGFTTFSTFGFETFALVEDRQWLYVGGNLLLSNGLGLVAVWLGYRVAQQI
jgi:CrcB protein